MKKNILSLIFILIILISNSCTKKCQTCTNVNGSGQDMTFCKEDFSSEDLYNESINLLEANGSKCK